MDSPEYRKAIEDCNLNNLIIAINKYVAVKRPIMGIPTIPGVVTKQVASNRSPLSSILYNAGNDCVRQDNYPFAIEVYKEALKQGNTDPSVYNNLASSYKRMGDHEQAMKTYQSLISQNPSYAPAYARVAILIQGYKLKSKKTPVQYFTDYFAKGGTDEQLTAFSIGLPQEEINAIHEIIANIDKEIKDKTAMVEYLTANLSEGEMREVNVMDKMLKQQASFMREAYNPNIEGRVKELFDALNARKTDEAIKIMTLDRELINSVDGFGSYPLHKAAHSCLFSVVKFILNNGGVADVRDKWSHTPLHWASCQTVVEMLIEHGADVEDRDDDGWTPLYAIARDGHIDSARYLIYMGAKVNVRTNSGARFEQSGWTPLHIAVHKKKTEVVRLLLAGDAEIDALSDDGETPFQVSQDEQIKTLLQEAKAGRVKSKRSQQYEVAQNKSLTTAFRQLSKRFPKLEWAKAVNPYTAIADECKQLMRGADFKELVTDYLNKYPDVERAFRAFESSVKRQQFSTWTDLPKNFNDPVWHGFFAERWRPAFLILDSPAKYFLIRDEGPLYWRNLSVECRNINSATWLLRQSDFWAMRHSFAHTNYAWRMSKNESFILAYDDKEIIQAQLSVNEAEAFAVIVSSFVSVLLDVFVSNADAQSETDN